MHAAGINLRYLGMLRDLANEEYISKTILVEMITRVVKNFVKRRLRFHSSNHEDSSSFQTILAACFSLVLGNSPASSLYWQEGSYSLRDTFVSNFLSCIYSFW
jgi:hypothetical protein